MLGANIFQTLGFCKLVLKSTFGVGIAVATLFLASPASADELVYQPVNPNFGGHPLNGSFLLGNASSQNGFTPPNRRKSPTEEFAETISRTLLSRIAREITDQIIGEDAQESGRFTVGDTFVEFERKGDQVLIEVVDALTGSETIIELPVPQLQ